MAAVPFALLLLLLLSAEGLAESTSEGSNHHILLRHALALGWRNLTLIYDDECFSARDSAIFVKHASAKGVHAAVLRTDGVREGAFEHVAKVVFVGETEKNILIFKSMLLQKTKPPYHSMIFGPKGSSQNGDGLFESEFRTFAMSAGFYRLQVTAGRAMFYRVQTFRDQDVLVQDRWDLGADGKFGNKSYDLMGATFTSLSKSWDPWLRQFDCQEITDKLKVNCKTSGILHIMMQILEKRFNFTTKYDEADVWGVVPVSGNISDPDAVWEGTLRGVFGDEYDASISVWTHQKDRDFFGDFTTSIQSRPCRNTLNSLQPTVDITLFLRPFTVRSWLGIIGFFGILVTFLVAPFWIFRERTDDTSYSSRIAVIFGWIFFLLINAYYAGALTMFLSTESTPPFESVRQGIRLYPEWKMIIAKGEENLILRYVNAGDPLMTDYWNIMQENRDELIQPTMKDALEKLLEPGYFLYQGSPLPVIKKYIELNHPGLQLKLQGADAIDTGSMILSNHSPMKAMLDLGIQGFRETGMLNALIRSGVPAMPKSFNGPQGEVLGGRQLGLIFFFYSTVIFGSAGVLVLEGISKRFFGRVFDRARRASPKRESILIPMKSMRPFRA